MENLKNVAPIEDFNWDAYENGETVTNVSHDELEKAYDGTLNKVNDREVVDGTVIAMNKREVVVNIGYKSDGIIPLNEFRYNPDLKVGDTVEVYIFVFCHIVRTVDKGLQPFTMSDNNRPDMQQ